MLNLKSLPDDPGCYLFKDKDKHIIYIGKAKSLKKRVGSYFQTRNHDEKTKLLVSEIADAEFFATSNEVEALILENNLIKRHKPKYNINLKDSRRFAYIIVTDEEYPRLLVSRDRSIRGKHYGPFVSAEYRDHVQKLLREKFMIRTCFKLPKKACLRFHINLCSAPCINNITKEEYISDIKNAEGFLKGNTGKLVKALKEEMKKKSDSLRYEKAKIIRDQISALKTLQEEQKVEADKRYDEDIINYIIDNDTVYLIVFNISRGVLATKNEFSFDYKEDFLEDFIVQYYSQSDVPRELILPKKLGDESIQRYLERIRKGRIRLTIPKKGEKLQLLRLVRRNIEISFLQESQMTNDLRNELNLNHNPNIIECFDISNLSGTNMTGSMVQFRNAKPDKSNYRLFKIRSVDGIDDFAAINEVVRRRYKRLKEESLQTPDLVVIDGGKGQLSAAMQALLGMELKIPVISIAKKFEEIYTPGRSRPIRLKKTSKALKLLRQIRDEAHRFAVKYHRLLRSKEMTS